MTNSDNAREREKMNVLADLNRAEMRKALWKAEELEAAVQSAQETKERLKSKSKSESKPRGKTEKEKGG